MTSSTWCSGGELVVRALVSQGVTRISCVPGESFLSVLDSLGESSIEIDVARHEAGAGNMALAHGKLSGRAGVAAVTRGPGAMHAAIAIHTAQQDALALVLLVGQVALRNRGRGGFQEMDYSRVFGSTAKLVMRLDVVDRIPETISHAFRVAEGGRPGPVVIEMPEDVLSQVSQADIAPRRTPMVNTPSGNDASRIHNLLSEAKRPLLILGRAKWSQETADLAEDFAQTYGVPVVVGFRCQDYIDNLSTAYVGHLGLSTDTKLVERIEQADLILAVGGHFGDAETQGYEIFGSDHPRTVVHVAATEHDVDRYVQSDLALVATPSEFFKALLMKSRVPSDASDWMTQLRREEELRRTPPLQEDDPLSEIMAWLQKELPEDAIIANGAGNYAVWVHQFMTYRKYGSQLAPASGAMGFGVPAGIAASLARPAQEVVVFAGDGCLSMALPELATLADSRAKLTIVLVNNSGYGTIRLHQERKYPGRVVGTRINNPDFVALARSFGFEATRVDTVEAFASAYLRARNVSCSSVIEVQVSEDRSTPQIKLSGLRLGTIKPHS